MSSTSDPSPSAASEPPYRGALATGLCALLAGAGAAVHYLAPETLRPWAAAAFLGAYLAGGFGPAVAAVSALVRGQLNVSLLMILAALGAAFIGDWIEGAVLLFLFSLSDTLEAFAMHRTARSIESLMKLRPQEANLVVPGEGGGAATERKASLNEIKPGDLVRVRPGERFPVDGQVVEGETWADESSLTGESEPIAKPLAAAVFAGTINGAGSVLVEVTREAADTTIERIIRLVQEARAQKTPTQRFVESWQRPYVVGVLLCAAAVFVGARWLHGDDWSDAFYHAMVLLVAASPCAVVVSSPAVMLSAIARAGRHGVLFKGAVCLESLGKVEVVAFDKTGTVTVGKPSVTQVWSRAGVDLERLLKLAGAVETRSEHPLAEPILDEIAERGLSAASGQVSEFHSHTGLGVHARVDGVWVGIGREPLFETHEVSLPQDLLDEAGRVRELGQTALLLVAEPESPHPQVGVVGVADRLREESAATFASLKRLGIRKVVLLSGDHARVAQAVASALRADEVRAGLLPEQKVVELRRLAEQGPVAMVGDGVNDAPALAAASVGVAMGGAGAEAALEVADVVLMRDDLRALPLAVWISRLARQRVRQNMIFAFAVIAALVLSTFFDLPLWMGVLGHEGSTVLVVINGLRLLWQKLPPF